MSKKTSQNPQASRRPDMNLATDSKRILYVLDKAISRSKFVAVLKSLVSDDGYLLNNILNSDDHFYIVQICRKYEFTGIKFRNRMESTIESVGAPKETRPSIKVIESSTTSPPASEADTTSEQESETLSSDSSDKRTKAMKSAKRLDKELSKVILLLEEYPEVHGLVARLQNETSPQMRFFIRCLKDLRDGIGLHLGESAAQVSWCDVIRRRLTEHCSEGGKNC
ncbi:UNVERIFIED_CONTAM: hypothetical protein PYX00_002692 [Menopon gallinae]|uniref:Uncharacterized protein n=1 Tax=Menopon gallinae TaxID=328185 RepID=A0AAW2HYH7_9NEOP